MDKNINETQEQCTIHSVSQRTIEFCYKWPSGKIDVHYRRIEGTPGANVLLREISRLNTFPDNRYFVRYVG